MSKTEIMNSISRSFHGVGLQFKKHSPEILVAAGIIGGVASAVLACRATTKLSGVLETAKKNIEDVHNVSENPEAYGLTREDYTEEDGKKDLVIVYAKTGLELAKLYAPSVGLGVLSISSILAGHNILRQRYVATAAAYTVLNKSFKDYRSRVVERFGKELDHELKYNIKSEKVETTVVDEKTGKEKTVKESVAVIDPNTIDDTSRIWYEGNPGWTKDPTFNLMYLKKQQAFATEKLKSQGYLFLNDVYEMLGYDKTALGQNVGWIYDEKNPVGDNFVDFGIYDIHNKQKIAFVNGNEKAILLEFNHDGNILARM